MYIILAAKNKRILSYLLPYFTLLITLFLPYPEKTPSASGGSPKLWR